MVCPQDAEVLTTRTWIIETVTLLGKRVFADYQVTEVITMDPHLV